MTEKPKEPSWKGQSRVQKNCHWCTKSQEAGKPPFRACSQCKEVIYCSKECQVASWPLHKGMCKSSVEARKQAATHPGMMETGARLKKWHGSHLALLRHAVICALDLANTPSNADNKMVFLEVGLKPDHEKLPAAEKYDPLAGFDMTNEEAHRILRSQPGGQAIIESGVEGHNHMKRKGGLGVATVLINAGDIVDVVRITLPSAEGAKKSIKANGDWGENWVGALKMAFLMNTAN